MHWELVQALLQHPSLGASTQRFLEGPHLAVGSAAAGRAQLPGSGATGPAEPAAVYVFQREMATVLPELVRLVGTDEMTTCIGVAVRDSASGRTSVGHFDAKDCVAGGVDAMLDALATRVDAAGTGAGANEPCPLELHLVGGFDDSTMASLEEGGEKEGEDAEGEEEEDEEEGEQGNESDGLLMTDGGTSTHELAAVLHSGAGPSSRPPSAAVRW
eukprot:SM003591S13026  [mRNA]  locus=s3591:2:1351:- [translate_table: standard]